MSGQVQFFLDNDCASVSNDALSAVLTVPTVVHITISTSDYVFPIDSVAVYFVINSLKVSSACGIDSCKASPIL